MMQNINATISEKFAISVESKEIEEKMTQKHIQ